MTFMLRNKAENLMDGMDKLFGQAIAASGSGLLGLENMSDSDLLLLRQTMSLYKDVKEFAVDQAELMDRLDDKMEKLERQNMEILEKLDAINRQNKEILKLFTTKENKEA